MRRPHGLPVRGGAYAPAGRGNRPPSGTARLPAGLGARDRSADGQIATGLLDVLPTKQHTSAEYAYLRQSVRTNNAAIVAEGAAKPTSVYSVVRVENSLQVIAHLSEGIPRYWLLDNQALEQSWTASCGSVWAWPWRPRCWPTSTPRPRPHHAAAAGPGRPARRAASRDSCRCRP